MIAFYGKYPVPSKIVVDNVILERVNEFNYLGYNLSFENETDIVNKITKFTKAMGIINNIMKPSLVQKSTRLRLYKTLARPVLTYGSEAWTIRRKDESRVTSNEMRFMRRTAGYTKWDHKRNEEIMDELGLEPILQHIQHYQNNWMAHLQRMPSHRIPRAILRYHPQGKRSLGRPKKRWVENSSLRP